MSLESALSANTQAIHALIAALQAGAGYSLAPQTIQQAAIEAGRQAAAAQVIEAARIAPADLPETGAEPVTFNTLKAEFLALVSKKDADVARKTLESLGLAKLSAATEAQYSAVLAAIQKAAA